MPGFFAAIDLVIESQVRILIERKPPNELWVTLLPSESRTSGHLETPLCVSGTAGELDEKLGEELSKHLKIRSDMSEVFDAANKAIQAEATAKAAKAGGSKQNTAPPVAAPPPVARTLTPAPQEHAAADIDMFGAPGGATGGGPPPVGDEVEDGGSDE